jgi:hypothetical protein
VVLFESAMAPAIFRMRLEDLDLKMRASVKKLELAKKRRTTEKPWEAGRKLRRNSPEAGARLSV